MSWMRRMLLVLVGMAMVVIIGATYQQIGSHIDAAHPNRAIW